MFILPEVLYDLDAYAKKLNDLDLISEVDLKDHNHARVEHLEYNSKQVLPGTLFVCKGANFKEEYLKQAIERGAIAYISEQKYESAGDAPHIIVKDIREAMAPIATYYNNEPQEKLKIIGIGGTKGKSTTAYFVKTILDDYLEENNKKPAGLISSIDTYDGGKIYQQRNTTPEAIDLQAILARAVDSGLEYLVMEVSSQALKYHRTDGIEFDVGIFLNIDEDHISPVEHPTYEDYLQSKALMFAQTKNLIVNLETQEKEYIFKKAKDADVFYTFSLLDEKADYYAYNIETIGLTSHFDVKTKDFEKSYLLSMPGRFNIENALSAIATADLLGIPSYYGAEALKHASVPGRMKISMTDDKEIIAVADYAHNRLSFEKLIQSMNEAYPEYSIVTVFGAPGGKALGRREELGTTAGRLADYVYVTMDDPDGEDVEDISKQIARYIKKEGTPYRYVEDREEAIRTAFETAEGKTILLVLGKGNETTMKIKGEDVPMLSDEDVIAEAIKEYNQKHV